ncbi:unnamed protein product, partial [Brassica napus]
MGNAYIPLKFCSDLDQCMQSGLQRLNYFPRPFWLALFVEGTLFTEAKLKVYAASSELPIPRNVLIPRAKDFVSAVSNMSHPYMICPLLFKGQPSGKQVNVHIKYHSIKDLPESEDEIAQWCRVQFLAKTFSRDVELLQQETFLNDTTIIDVYIKK